MVGPGSRFLYGTSSWTAPGWVGSSYPVGMKPGEFLSFHATQFATVEADNTYYATPSRELVRGWDRKTPEGFVLSAKFTRSIVHCGEKEKSDPARVLVPEIVGRDAGWAVFPPRTCKGIRLRQTRAWSPH